MLPNVLLSTPTMISAERLRTTGRQLFLRIAAVCVVVALPSAASAQEPWPSVVIRGGALVADFGSDVRLDASVGSVGTSIDLENDLGFQTQAASWFADGVWRMTRRNQLQIAYEGVTRDVSQSFLSDPITFRNQTFTAGVDVAAFLDTFYLSANYGFAFVANPIVEFGASIGVTVVRLHTGMELSAQVSGSTLASRQLTDAVRYTVPVPLPGLFLNIRPHPRVTINASTQIIKATLGDYTASLVEAKSGLDVRVVKAIGVGGAYYFNRTHIERDATLTNGSIQYRFNGPQAYATLSF